MSNFNYCDPKTGSYGYVPSLAAGIVFCVLYGLMTIYVTINIFRKRLWFISITIGGLLEIIGWIGRSVAHNSVCDTGMFTMQICCLILAPALFSAALYILLGIIIQEAPKLSPLSAKMYLVVFCTMDFISLVLQAVGGALASTASTQETLDVGTWIMVGGILFQILGMTCFACLGILFYLAARKESVSIDRAVLSVSIFATVMIFLRNIYRVVELIQGWNGYVNTHERFIIGLDGVPMVLCMFSLCYLIFVDGRKEGLLHRNVLPKAMHQDAPSPEKVDDLS